MSVWNNYHILTMGEVLLPLQHLRCDLIFCILVGNKDMHKSMDEFIYRSIPTTDYRVSCH